MTTQIGTIELEAQTIRIGCEYAAWHDTIRVEAGSYPVFADVADDGKIRDFPGPYWIVEGPVVSSDWASRCGGMLIGRNGQGIDENLGEVIRHRCSCYAHAVAWGILEGDSRITLSPEFEARRVPFTYDGEERETAGLFRK